LDKTFLFGLQSTAFARDPYAIRCQIQSILDFVQHDRLWVLLLIQVAFGPLLLSVVVQADALEQLIVVEVELVAPVVWALNLELVLLRFL
jgi:hypothetical protein